MSIMAILPILEIQENSIQTNKQTLGSVQNWLNL